MFRCRTGFGRYDTNWSDARSEHPDGTPEILSRVPHAFITLHVGIGTFRAVKVDDLSEHQMHSERFGISPETADAVNAASRVVAVGTTSTRVLESVPVPPPARRSDSRTAGLVP